MAPKNFQTSDRPQEMRRESAVLEALDMFKQPVRARSLRRHGLPAEMLEAIKIAAGDQETTDRWAEGCREAPDTIRQAAVFFLQQTIAKSGDDKFRMLGLADGASREEVRLHKRWLLKWLHPDRNPSKWETVLFHRISSVAEALEGSQFGLATKPEGLTNEVKPTGASPHHRSERRSRSTRGHRNLHTPVRQFSWQSLLQRAARRILIGGVLFALAVIVIVMFGGPVQSLLQSLMLGN